MDATKVEMPDGKTYSFAPATFSSEVVELIEQLDAKDAAQQSPGRVLRLMRNISKDCMIRGGHSDKEAERFLCSIPLGKGTEAYLAKIKEAIGLG